MRFDSFLAQMTVHDYEITYWRSSLTCEKSKYGHGWKMGDDLLFKLERYRIELQRR
jgi:hypothetical protein